MPTVRLSPIFNGWQGFTPGGLPLGGGFVYTYLAGTSTLAATYTTTSGSVANANPIPLGSDGRPPSEIWLPIGSAYKFVLTGFDLVPIATYDDILGVSDINNLNAAGNTVLGTTGNTLNVANGALSIASGNTTVGGNLSVAGNSTFTGDIAVNGNTTIGNASTDSLTVAPATITYNNPVTHTNNHTFSGALTAGGTLTVTGSATFNGATTLGDASADAVTFVGTPAGQIAGGTYTPTFSNTVNVDSATLQGLAIYIRAGSAVIGEMSVSIDPTATTTNTFIEFTVPVTTANFASSFNGCGLGKAGTTNTTSIGNVQANAGTQRLQYIFTSTGTVAETHKIHWSYVIQ